MSLPLTYCGMRGPHEPHILYRWPSREVYGFCEAGPIHAGAGEHPERYGRIEDGLIVADYTFPSYELTALVAGRKL